MAEIPDVIGGETIDNANGATTSGTGPCNVMRTLPLGVWNIPPLPPAICPIWKPPEM